MQPIKNHRGDSSPDTLKSSRRRRLLVAYLVVGLLGLLVIWATPKVKPIFNTPKKSNWDFSENNHGHTRDRIMKLVGKEYFNDEDIAFISKGLRQGTDEDSKRDLLSYVLLPRYPGGGGAARPASRQAQCKEILIEYLNDDSCTETWAKGWALHLLGNDYRDPDSIELYKRFIQEYDDPGIQLVAAKALYHFGEKEIAYRVYEEVAAEGYPPGILDLSHDVDAREMLIRTLKYSHNPVAQACSMYYLATIGEKETILPVYQELLQKVKDGTIPNPPLINGHRWPDPQRYADAISWQLTMICGKIEMTQREWEKRQ